MQREALPEMVSKPAKVETEPEEWNPWWSGWHWVRGPGGHPITNGLSETQRAQNLPLLCSEEEAGIHGIVFF